MPKTILITGGAGFVGHHCVEHILKNTDWNIIILDSLSYAGDMQRIVEIEKPETINPEWMGEHPCLTPLLRRIQQKYKIQ